MATVISANAGTHLCEKKMDTRLCGHDTYELWSL